MTQKSVSDLRVKILDALSDPTRLELLEFLSQGERCVCEILPAFKDLSLPYLNISTSSMKPVY